MEQKLPEVSKYRDLKGVPHWLFVLSPILVILLCVYHLFRFSFLGTMLSVQFYYFLMMLVLPFSFLAIPPSEHARRDQIPWFDALAAALVFAICLFLFIEADEIFHRSWFYSGPLYAYVASLILNILILELARRVVNFTFMVITLFFAVVPIFAEYLPGIFKGVSLDFWKTMGCHAMSAEGFTGLPMRVVGDLLIGFLIFSVVLLHTGGGKFLINLAYALLGHVRGGPAKVAIIASALFGTMSGSALANVVGTGVFTIPMMKRVGYPGYYAGAVEAVASTGGCLMPPIMGAVAFIMADVLGIPYHEIIVYAFPPACLYYYGLYMQVDAYAAKVNLRGMPKEERPSLAKTLKEGWHYIFIILFLLWGLIYMKWEEMTPYYGTVILLFLSLFRKETRPTWGTVKDFIVALGRLLADTMAMIVPLGFLTSALFVTGMGGSFSAGLVFLGGGNPYALLFIGVAICYLFGMAGMITAPYIFMAIFLAPPLINLGFNPIAVHLFIIYNSMLAPITPPVAQGAFLGAAIAGADKMKTAWQAMRLGVVIFIIPFFFVLEPSLVLQGEWTDSLYNLSTATVGIALLAAGLEGYLVWGTGIGRLGIIPRSLIFIAGLLLAIPGWRTDLIGALLASATILILMLKNKSALRKSAMLKPL